MLINEVPCKVLLPKRILDKRSNKELLIQEVKEYMKRYPEYIPERIENGFVICKKKE